MVTNIASHTAMTPLFQQLFEATPHPYLLIRPDATFTIVAVNNRYLDVTETNRTKIVGRGLFEVFPNNPDDKTGSGVGDLRAFLMRVVRDGAYLYNRCSRANIGGGLCPHTAPVVLAKAGTHKPDD